MTRILQMSLSSGSLVRRLRIACLMLVAGVLVAAVTEIWFTRTVDANRREMIDRAIPTSLIVQRIFQQVAVETRRAERLRDPRRDPEPLYRDYLESGEDLAGLITRLASVDGTTASEIDRAMTAFHAATQRLYRVRREAAQVERRRLALEARAADEASRALEPLLLLRERGLGALVSLSQGPTDPEQPSLQALVNCLAAQDALVFRMTALSTAPFEPSASPVAPPSLRGSNFDTALDCPDGTPPAMKRQLSERLRRHAAQLAAVLAAADDPRGAQNVAERLERDLEGALDTHRIASDRVRNLVLDVVTNAGSNLTSAAAKLERMGRIATGALLIQAALMFLTIGVVVVLVEYQLNRRLATMISALHIVSRGRFDHPIRIGGNDEIAELADMLRAASATGRDLTRSNMDLESFSHAASHDLRSPLNAIGNLADWILEDARNELSAESAARLELLRDRVRRLSQLLEDLLNYARRGSAGDLALMDLGAEAREAHLSNDPEGRYELVVEDTAGSVEMSVAPVKQIIHNLISNAIKHHDRDHGRITFTTRTDGPMLEIAVGDDGPGIAPAYHDRVFRLFEKLETRDKVAGSGLGLALVRKLALRHGGSVDIVSDPAEHRGTTFIVRLSLIPTEDTT